MVLAVNTPEQIVKRDGRVVQFNYLNVQVALSSALESVGQLDHRVVDYTDSVINIVASRYGDKPHVEQVQDTCELVLQSVGQFDAAKHFILYRAEHAKERASGIPENIKNLFSDDKKYFPTPIQEFQFYDKYSRFDYDLQRRETWSETVNRAVDYLVELAQPYGGIDQLTYHELSAAIRSMEVMPSMRLLAMAGPAARRDNTSIYNCSFLPVSDIDAFVENMLICMAGCGVGYSVESMYVNNLPRIAHQSAGKPSRYIVDDTARGWADALRYGLNTWFDGGDVIFDTSGIRAAGTPLRTKGGRASGPLPLLKLLDYSRNKILSRQGKQLRTIDAHDIMCAIGGAVVSGGVRRTAMISLFDEDDKDMLYCKSGDFDRHDPQRWNANNSMVWTAPITQAQLLDRFKAMLDSERGEPGIFNRHGLLQQMPARRNTGYQFGSNPCGEIVLRPYEFCNLSIAVARSYDNPETLARKVQLATIIGTIQSLATHFPNLRPEWKKNAEEERLLGVDITGQQDAHNLLGTPGMFDTLRKVAVDTNIEWAQKFGINQSASVTTVKPSGNSSQLLNCSSGLHPRWAPYYIRNVRVAASSPIAQVLRECGVPLEIENGGDTSTLVASFPMKSPDGAVVRNDMSAIGQCEWWLHNKLNWTEHNPSVTITYTPDEVIELTSWVWTHRDSIGGMAFLPKYEAKYDQLPYIEITEEEYNERINNFPEIDFSLIYKYDDRRDNTTAAQEQACLTGLCDV